ncbi:hypothetical protein BO70DRAFT_135802 [Aspergillus heteromorphus CBS 117.55]|uniref:Uncharacterized protein n=1 Tax=Aspergillus heteromorphus CBS 117.55 TaxID=1448321 RepID=A0A317WUT4_9EURO|nr:uncharacterized protein BO70DRAFT_135802 [Aspergillus heteromorphus CBS 117.55]PWY90184.1 hypothetical protein BO70DRAFT_135802 [Aspergillus heteromorphus CBS 117.55]
MAVRILLKRSPRQDVQGTGARRMISFCAGRKSKPRYSNNHDGWTGICPAPCSLWIRRVSRRAGWRPTRSMLHSIHTPIPSLVLGRLRSLISILFLCLGPPVVWYEVLGTRYFVPRSTQPCRNRNRSTIVIAVEAEAQADRAFVLARQELSSGNRITPGQREGGKANQKRLKGKGARRERPRLG